MDNIERLFPDKEMYEEFLAFHKMTDKERAEFSVSNEKRFNSLSPEQQKRELEIIKEGVEKAAAFTDDIIIYDMLGDLPDYVSFSKIAKSYFGKTSGWLYHRLKGTLINGKPARFTTEQKQKLAEAFSEIAKEFNKASLMLISAS